MIGVSENQANLRVDCERVEDVRGGFDAELQPRGRFDESGGHLSVAQKVAYPYSVQVCKLTNLDQLSFFLKSFSIF